MIDEDTVLANVEEMLEGFEWRGRAESGSISVSGSGSAGAMGMGSGGKGDEIEKRLVGELKALEAVGLCFVSACVSVLIPGVDPQAAIHAIIESDDRVNFVIQHLDDALAELERMDLTFGMYTTQLNVSISPRTSVASSRLHTVDERRYRPHRISKSWITSSNVESASPPCRTGHTHGESRFALTRFCRACVES